MVTRPATDNVIFKIAKFLPNTKELVTAGEFDENAAYWSEEMTEWSHRRSVWLWIRGGIPEGLQIDESPMILDWSALVLCSPPH